MKQFTYTITDPNGLHARPAGILVKESSKYSSEITLQSGDKKGNSKKIFSVMGMGIKCGDKVTVNISGTDEDNAVAELEVFFKSNL